MISEGLGASRTREIVALDRAVADCDICRAVRFETPQRIP